ncbi:alpha/beta hydrolase [Actinophytocola sp.]|uniref:alpha/beta fold hydrolase n=1 Tax=Actinophytocola sp. TaxID=1872138 RepID=UPI002ED5F939
MPTVIADDGVRLHVEVDGDQHADVTIVLCHGYTLTSATWRLLRRRLGHSARLVMWDQRGHGRSERGPAAHATVEQLGRDTVAVLEQAVPAGPVVLVGHSMGAMGVLALAHAHPELFGRDGRVVAVALINTSAGPVSGLSWLPAFVVGAAHQLATHAMSVLRWSPMSALRRSGVARTVARLVAVRGAFSSPVPHPVTSLLMEMIESTPIEVVKDFLPGFRNHHLFPALPVLGQVHCLVLAGADDMLTPPADSEAIAGAVPDARLVVVPRAGHMLPLEHPDRVAHMLAEQLSDIRAFAMSA